MIFDCKTCAQQILEDATQNAAFHQEIVQPNFTPSLAILSIGEDTASKVYLKNKTKVCESVGIKVATFDLPATSSKEEIIFLIQALNDDPNTHAIIVQLPLPKSLKNDTFEILNSIDPKKDVDGFTVTNIGQLNSNSTTCAPCPPCTAAGIMCLLKWYNIDVDGKHVVIIGRSDIVGRPLAAMMLRKNATVTVCHSHTQNLAMFTKNADILVCAAGQVKLITADMVKQDAIVIDVGINRDENGKLCGDVDFENVKDSAAYITKVPGGVGLLTTAMLASQVIELAIMQTSFKN